MFDQYPHYLFVYVAADATQDENGNFIPGQSEWVLFSMCREEANGSGSVVKTDDGQAITYKSKVFLPLGAGRLSVGDKIIVSETSSVDGFRRVDNLQVLRFDQMQLHSRLWV
jgi:hypothetical protein